RTVTGRQCRPSRPTVVSAPDLCPGVQLPAASAPGNIRGNRGRRSRASGRGRAPSRGRARPRRRCACPEQGRRAALNSSQLSSRPERHNFAMRHHAVWLIPAVLVLAVTAWLPSSAVVAQGRQGGAGAGAQGGAFGQGGGRGQLPPRDATGANMGGDQAAGTAVIRGRVVSADSGTPIRRAQVRAQSGELRANRLVSTDAQ